MTRRSNAPGGRAIGRPYVDPGNLSENFSHPVFEYDRRIQEIERAFYRHLLRVIDLDALFDLEQQLWSQLQDRRPLTDDQVLDLANAIIARALERVGRDPIRAMKGGAAGPDGRVIPVPEAPHEQCPFCDGEPEDGEPGRRRARGRRGEGPHVIADALRCAVVRVHCPADAHAAMSGSRAMVGAFDMRSTR